MRLVGRRTLRIVAVALASSLALTLSACGGDDDGGSTGKTYTLKLATPTPAAHHWSKNALNPWIDLVKEKTDGRVKVELYEGGSLGSFTSVLTDLEGGLYDVGMVIPSYFLKSKAFAYSALTLPFAYPDPETGGKIGSAYMKAIGDQTKIDGVRYLGTAVSDTYVAFSTKKIQTIDDLRGKKIRAQSALDGSIAKSWGGTPVDVPIQESYEAIEKSVIDVSPYSPVGSLGLKTYEVAPYVLATDAWGTVTIPAMSEKFYSGLPDDLKKLFDDDLGPALADLMQQSYVKEDKNARETLKSLTKENGGEWIELDDAERDKFRASAGTQWDEWVKSADKQGFDGKALLDAYLTAMKAAGVEPPAGIG